MKKQIKEFCEVHKLTIDEFYGKSEIKGNLNLRSLTSIPEGFNPTVRSYLDLSSLTSIPEGFNPTVEGSLDLSSLTSIPEGFNPTVGGYLNLRSLTSIPEGFNPTVRGGLYLDSLTSIPKGFNPTVGGYLDLRSITSIPKGFNPTVGGYLCLPYRLSAPTKPTPKLISWENGKYVKVDGIFTEVVSQKGNIYKVRKLSSTKEFYLITDGNGSYAHGNTLKEAKEDLLYKITGDANKEDYQGLPLTHKFSFIDAVTCYRAITGSCAFGVKQFVEENKVSKRKKYSIETIIKLTEGAYGHNEFRAFFKSPTN